MTECCIFDAGGLFLVMDGWVDDTVAYMDDVHLILSVVNG